MGNKGIKTVIVCVIILVFVLEQVQVEGKSCCRNITSRNCYNVCRLQGSEVICATLCGCKIISDVTCPPDYPNFNFLPNCDVPDRIEYCRLGCRSSVCGHKGNVNGVKAMNIDVKTRNEACDRFCNGDASITSTAA